MIVKLGSETAIACGKVNVHRVDAETYKQKVNTLAQVE
jgi:hypothetical protein